MPIRKAKPIQFRAKGVSDTVDATDVMPGAMTALTNLIPAPQSQDGWVPRPASTLLTSFAGFNTPANGEALFSNGTRLYGFIQTARNAGQSEPFIFDTKTGNFVTIANVTAGNTPFSTANVGEWTPPTIDQVGSYVIFTHPGFTLPNAFGWLDMGGFTLSTSGVTQNTSTLVTGNPSITGVNPGMSITGVGIPANTFVVSTVPFILNTLGSTHTNTTLDNLVSTTGVDLGQPVIGAGIPIGTVVSAILSPTSVQLSLPATATANNVGITFTGAVITMSQAFSIVGGTIIPLAIAGGTFAAPIWGAGNLNTTPLVAVATAVAQYAGSACYAVNTTSPPSAAVVFSDAGSPLQCTNAPNSQILTFRNAVPVSALKGLPLNNAVSGGILQSLIAFQEDSAMFQITGAPVTSNLVVNSLNDSVGTLAPNSVQPTPKGLLLSAPDGVRRINDFALITAPIGRRGGGVTTPFMFATNPSRICAAYNESVYRISVQNGSVIGTPYQEYWYHEDDEVWSGPHTFPASVITATQVPHGYAFFAAGIPAKLWIGSAFASLAAQYTENSVQMTFAWQTSLLPDNQQMQMNALIDTLLAISIPPQQTIQASFIDEQSNTLGTAQLTGPATAPSVWGTMVWGTDKWGAGATYYRQHHVLWSAPIVFKQGQLSLSGNCVGGLQIGNLNMRYSELGYGLLTNTVAAA